MDASSIDPTKNDSEKARWDLFPPSALQEIAEVFTFGAKKYADRNYLRGDGLQWGRVFAAMMRHMWAWWGGEELDPETGKSHLAHAGCCVLILMELRQLRSCDDRGVIG